MSTQRFSLASYGPVISDDKIGTEIYKGISKLLADNDNNVVVDFSGIISMTTYCAKEIFGQLCKNLTRAVYQKRIQLENASDDIQFIISRGVDSAIA